MWGHVKFMYKIHFLPNFSFHMKLLQKFRRPGFQGLKKQYAE